MNPGQRATCSFLQNPMTVMNKTLQIVPIVVKGPCVVRHVVAGGKPAIIGNKLPINYVYGAGNDKQAMYLEADLDVAADLASPRIRALNAPWTVFLSRWLGMFARIKRHDQKRIEPSACSLAVTTSTLMGVSKKTLKFPFVKKRKVYLLLSIRFTAPRFS
eukprot:scaffold1667_cov173-Amphora_coffeaeformis.AAC.30